MTLSAKLQRLTELHNLRAVARAAQISKEAMSQAVQGKVQPRRATVAAIARALHVDPDWLNDPTPGWPPVWTHTTVKRAAAVA